MKFFLLLTLLINAACNKQIVEQSNVSVKVKKGDVSVKMRLSGHAEPFKDIKYQSPIDAKVVKFNVQVGDRVKKDDLLVEFDLNAKKKLETQYKRKQSKIQKEWITKNKQVEKVVKKIQYYESLPPFPGQKSLIKKNNIAKEILSTELAEIDSRLRHIRKILEDDKHFENLFQIKAKSDGVILSLGKKSLGKGKFVKSGSTLFVAGGTEQMKVDIQVTERQVVDLKRNSIVRVTLPALREVIEGKIEKINEVSLKNSNSLNSYQVTITFSAPRRMKVGMKANIDVIPRERIGVSFLPQEALLKDEQGRFWVYKYDNGDWVETLVEVGLIGDQKVEIRKGVALEDEILLSGKNAISI